MKYSTLKYQALSICFAAMLMSGCSSPAEKKATVVNPNYEIASPDYSALAAKAMTSWSKLDFDAWTSMMADDVEFYFPDGDAGTRTKLTGKPAVAEWWNNWKQTSGIQSMTYLNHVDIPINAKDTMAYSGLTGVMVISYFSNELVFNEGIVNIRMDFVAHFNSQNLIDRYYTYFDRTKILEVTKKDYLDKGKK
jgi:ketosteroid isomerase-like protein